MADITKIKLEDETYDIKDSTSRSQIQTLNTDLDTLTDRVDLLTNEKIIIIGDSYALDRTSTINISGWAVRLKQLRNLSNENCIILADNGGGFYSSGDLGTFEQAITNANISNKSEFTKIVVCGGLNDIQASSKSDILNSILSFKNYCNINYPNAKIYIGMIGWETDINHTSNGQYVRYQILNKCLPAYQESIGYNLIYLNGVENVMHNYDGYYDNSHPNQAMCNLLAWHINEAINNGYTSVTYDENPITFSSNTINATSYFSLKERLINNEVCYYDYNEYGSDINFLSNLPTVANDNFGIGEVNLKYTKVTHPYQQLFTCIAYITDSTDTQYKCIANIYLASYNYLGCKFNCSTSLEGKSIKKLTLCYVKNSFPAIMQ